MTDFEAFPKIYRFNREVIITEKIDGTNAQVCVELDGTVRAGSRNKWITPESDNYGFARWVKEHEDELRTGLGTGIHYGEWWGQGIQRRYDLKEKRFSLFNVSRWTDDVRPKCCHVVPTINQGLFSTNIIEASLAALRDGGSMAAPGFMKPEGIVIFHVPSGHLFKVTLEKDDQPKGVDT